MADCLRWRKILYENQNVPDNYVDNTFLDDLKKNLYTRTYDFWTVVVESGVVTQQLCSTCLFVLVFVYMNERLLSPQWLFTISSILTMIGYVVKFTIDYIYTDDKILRQYICVWNDVKTGVIFLAFSFGLSPILMTLTKTISTDTIYAMTFFMLLANLLFHDYGASAVMVSQALSLNAAAFASVCLASRLATTWHAFATVTFAFELFALWPVLRRKLKACIRPSHVFMSVLLGTTVAIAMTTVSVVAAVLFVFLHLFITFVCPAWLIRLQPYKNTIHGPWDEAVIKN